MVSLTWPKVGATSGNAGSNWSSQRSKCSCNRWRNVVQCVLARAFQPFNRGPGDESGTGLGLAIVHAIATSHGGSVRLENRPAGGAAVTRVLPARLAPAMAATAPAVGAGGA